MKLITWNMQGASHSTENKWNEGVRNFLTMADICCLQECGGLPASAKEVNMNFSGIIGLEYWYWGVERDVKHILFYPWDVYGNRCNLAIVSNTQPLGGALLWPAAGPAWRPALGFTRAANDMVFSLHCISGTGADANGLINAINAAFPSPANAWVAGGDYNREPGTLAFAPPIVICPPTTNTYSTKDPTKKIDYCIKNNGAAVNGTIQAPVMSDHYAVLFDGV